MNNNLYWSVYKNLEKELIDLSNSIHIDDKQLEVYSIKIVELLIRTVVEVESISKELYFHNGGTKSEGKDLFFDTDCIGYLENKWLLSRKQIQVSTPNFYLENNENKFLNPLKKSKNRGTSSSDWQQAYQAVKHDRSKSLKRGNLKHLIRAMGGLYILNIYYKDNMYELGKDSTGTNFDSSLSSSIFSVKIHPNLGISAGIEYKKSLEFDEYIYLIKPTDQTRDNVQSALKLIDNKIREKASALLFNKLNQQLSKEEFMSLSQDEIKAEFNSVLGGFNNDDYMKTIREEAPMLKNSFDDLNFDAVLNKQQY